MQLATPEITEEEELLHFKGGYDLHLTRSCVPAAHDGGAVAVKGGRSRADGVLCGLKSVTHQGGDLWRTKGGTRKRGETAAPILGRPT
jgi:hypothetical protein